MVSEDRLADTEGFAFQLLCLDSSNQQIAAMTTLVQLVLKLRRQAFFYPTYVIFANQGYLAGVSGFPETACIAVAITLQAAISEGLYAGNGLHGLTSRGGDVDGLEGRGCVAMAD